MFIIYVFGDLQESLVWNEVRSLSAASLRAGNAPGVYLIGGLHEKSGIPMLYEWVYVGRSNSLGRRLTEHLPANEQNPQLRTWLRTAGNVLVARFAVTTLPDSISLERHLVRTLTPKHNRIAFKNGEDYEHTSQYA